MIIPSTGERYLSTPLFDDVPGDMTEDEESIAHSTPNYNFDSAPPPAPQEEDEEEFKVLGHESNK